MQQQPVAVTPLEELARDFAAQRQIICNKLPSFQNGDQYDLGFALNIINCVFNHDQGTPERIEYESILHATRYKARILLTQAKAFFKDESPEREYLISRGYCHLVNAFVIGAPIDAWNWMCLKGMKLDRFNNWGQVLFYTFQANDRPYLDLLDEFIRFQRTSTWKLIDDDPWPSKTMYKLMTNMVNLFNEYSQDESKNNESTKRVLDSMESVWDAMVMVVVQGRYDQIEDN